VAPTSTVTTQVVAGIGGQVTLTTSSAAVASPSPSGKGKTCKRRRGRKTMGM
jgi:hypothetical protein